MRSSSARPAPLALRLRAPGRAQPRAPVGARRRRARPSAAATAPASPARHQEPGLAVVDHGAHARVVGGDRRQPAGHRLDQDDPERLRRLGRQQEEVGGAQHAGQLGVGDRAEEVDALADPGARGRARGSRRAARRRRRRPGGRASSPSRGERVDRDVEPLEVVGAVEGRDERRHDRVRRRSRARSRRPGSSPPGANSSVSTPFGISTSFAGSSLAGPRAGTGPSRRGPAESTQTRSAARIRSGATVCS